MMPRSPYRAILTLGLAALTLAAVPGRASAHSPAVARSRAAPVFVFPSNGQSFPLNGTMLFQVQPMSGAKGYLWSFLQGGAIMYQNLAWDGELGGTTYSIKKGSTAERRLHGGPMQVWVRALMGNGQWSASSSVTVQLQGSGGSGPNPQPTTKAGPPSAGTVIYQANWSSGPDGWSLPQSWDTVNGQVVNDGTNTSLRTQAKPQPIHPPTPNYAVQADIQLIRLGSGNCRSGSGHQEGFGIVVRGDNNGYYALGVSLGSSKTLAFIKDVPWATYCTDLQAANLTQSNTSVDTSWHTYRAEVRGNDIRLLIDGNVAADIIDNHHLHGPYVALFDMGTIISVRNFQVIAL